MNNTFKILSKDGLTTRFEGRGLTYHGSYLSPSYVEIKEIASNSIIPWQIGDYLDYGRTGMRYKLHQIPQVEQRVEDGNISNSGEGVVYSSVCLYAPTKDLEIAMFVDVVNSDNGIHFSTQEQLSTFEDISGIARRIQVVLDYFYPDSWSVSIQPGLSTVRPDILEAREFSFQAGDTVLDVLGNIYSVWDSIGWIHKVVNGVNHLVIGGANTMRDDNTIQGGKVGKGLGINKLKFSVGNNSDLCTRLFVYGSSRNLPLGYYKGLDIYNAASVDIQNLMIPTTKWGKTDGKPDARKAYIDADEDAIGFLGIRPKVIYMDDEEYGNYYPSIEGVTIGDIREAKAAIGDTTYVPSSAYSDGERADVVVSSAFPFGGDDGVISSEKFSSEASRTCSGSMSKTTVRTSTTTLSKTSSPVCSIPVTYGDYPSIQLQASKPIATVTGTANATVSAVLFITDSLTGDENTYNHKEIDLEVSHVAGATTYGLVIPENTVIGYEDFFVNMYPSKGQTGTLYFWVEVTITDSAGTKSYAMKNSITARIINGNEPYVYVSIKQIGFNINDQRATKGGIVGTIEMKDGMCAGRSFNVKVCAYDPLNDQWALQISRTRDTSVGMMYPNTTYKIAPGDHFVLTNILMPDLYVETASQRLFARAKEVLKELSRPILVIEPKVDAMAYYDEDGDSTALGLLEGRYFDFSSIVIDTTFLEYWDYSKLIDTITISENDSTIPTFSLTLREKKRKSFKVVDYSSYTGSSSSESSSDSSSSSSSSSSIPTTVVGAKRVTVNGETFESDDQGNITIPDYRWGSESNGQSAELSINGTRKDVSILGHSHSQYLTEAPINNKIYGRKQGIWYEIEVDTEGKADKSYVDEQLELKADKTYVNTQLGTKASTDYVNGHLATKADKTYVDEQLNLKANTTYVDDKVAGFVSQETFSSALSIKADKSSTLAGYGIQDAFTKDETRQEINAGALFEVVTENGKAYVRLKSTSPAGQQISGLFTQDNQSLSAGGVGDGVDAPPRKETSKGASGSYTLNAEGSDTIDTITISSHDGTFSIVEPTGAIRTGFVHRLVLWNLTDRTASLSYLPRVSALFSDKVTSIASGEALYAEYFWTYSGKLIINCRKLTT